MASKIEDFPLEEVDAPSDNEIKSVTALAREQWKLEREIEDLEAKLAEKREKLKNVAERELPNLMVEVGMTSLTLKNGAKLEIDTATFGSITKEREPAAHDWLEENGHEDLIKREFNVRFNRQDEKWAAKFQRDLNQRKRPLDVRIKRSVHPGTLNKWIRECELAGVVIPTDLFGVYKKRVTKIVPPKKPVEI